MLKLTELAGLTGVPLPDAVGCISAAWVAANVGWAGEKGLPSSLTVAGAVDAPPGKGTGWANCSWAAALATNRWLWPGDARLRDLYCVGLTGAGLLHGC